MLAVTSRIEPTNLAPEALYVMGVANPSIRENECERTPIGQLAPADDNLSSPISPGNICRVYSC